jgi:hypothetical protein
VTFYIKKIEKLIIECDDCYRKASYKIEGLDSRAGRLHNCLYLCNKDTVTFLQRKRDRTTRMIKQVLDEWRGEK